MTSMTGLRACPNPPPHREPCSQSGSSLPRPHSTQPHISYSTFPSRTTLVNGDIAVQVARLHVPYPHRRVRRSSNHHSRVRRTPHPTRQLRHVSLRIMNVAQVQIPLHKLAHQVTVAVEHSSLRARQDDENSPPAVEWREVRAVHVVRLDGL